MQNIKKILLLCISILVSLSVFSQEERKGLTFIKNFSPQDYGEHIQNFSILQDHRGMMYIGNVNGVMEYDGESFRLIELPDKTTCRSMDIDKNNRIYIGSAGEFGYLKPNKKGKTEYISLIPKLSKEQKNFGNVWDTKQVGKSVFFRTYHKLFRFINDTIQVLEAKESFSGSFVINDTYYVKEDKGKLFKFQGNKLIPAPYGNLFKNSYNFEDGIEFTDQKAMFSSSSKLYLYNPNASKAENAIKRFYTQADKRLIRGEVYDIQKASNNKIIIGTLSEEGAIVVDSAGRTLQKINNDLGLQKGSIYAITTDKRGNAWLAMSYGFAKVEISSSITFWNEHLGLEGSVEDLIRFNNTLYIATNQGFYFADKQGKIHHIKGFTRQAWDFLIFHDPNNPEKTRLLATGDEKIFEIRNNKLHRLHTTKDKSTAFDLYQTETHPEILYVGVNDGLIGIKYKNGKLTEETRIMNMEQNVRSVMKDKQDNLWLGLFRKGAVKLELNDKGTKAKNETLYTQEDGFRSTKNILIYPFNNRLIFASNKGFHRYNYKKDRFIPDSTLGDSFGNGSRDVFNFQEMEDGTVWCSGLNNRKGKIGRGTPNEQGNYSWEYRKFRRIPNMMIFSLYAEENGNTWFGGSEGLYRYRQEKKYQKDKFPTLIRKVTIGRDSMIFSGNTYKTINKDTFTTFKPKIKSKENIQYNSNTVTFQFAALSYKNIDENKYAFYLEGYEDNWSDWTKTSLKQYTNLREGDYIFHVKSRNTYGTEGKHMRYKFSIAPPWYRNALAYIGYFIFAGLLFYLGILINTRRLKEKNKKLEQIIQERTSEISEQKDEIEQQKEEIEQQHDSIYNQASQLRLINEELRKLTIVARETDNAVIIIDPDGTIEWINEGAVRLFGYNIEEIKQYFGSNFLEASSAENIAETFNKVKTNKTSEIYESTTIAKNGNPINTYTTLTPVLNDEGEVEKIIAIDSDIRELKKAEKELKRLNATKDKFFSIIAHDLKNPFGSLLGATDVLIRKFDQFDREKTLHFLRNIKLVAKQGYDLLINLLEWSRAQTGRLEFEMQELNLFELVKSNVELLKTQATNKKIEIINEVDPAINVYADQNTILTVLRNLLTNAIKYTHNEGKVRISTNTNHEYVTVTVADDGIGIPKEKLNKLFKIDENYSQKGTNKETGTGLGLILCKEFVEKNKGEIHVESEKGEGSKFIFTLLRQSGK